MLRTATFVLTVAALVAILLWVVRGWQCVPPFIKDKYQAMGLSKNDISNDVILEFRIDGKDVIETMRWYKDHGYNFFSDSVQTNGYGSHGYSFELLGTNQYRILIVKHWQDF